MDQMKAIVFTKYGPPDVLQVKEVEKPEPKDDEVLIRIRAAEATKSDCELRSFTFPVKWYWLPLRIAMGLTGPKKQILGGYFAGEKEEELLALKALIEEGQIKSVIDKIYSPEQAAEAHRRVETEQRLGIVVISMVKS
jgi:NADPH:quinone reductase-like Zn-dependent oxidoreductase